MRKLLLSACLFLAIGFHVSAQKISKKPLDHTVFDRWQSITGQRISNDGKWIGYIIKPQQGDAELIIKDSKNTSSIKIPRADTVKITGDSKFAICLIRPFYKDTRQAKIKKKKQADFPKDTLGIIALGSSSVKKVPAIRSFKIAEDAAVIAYLATADTLKKPASGDTTKKAVAAAVAPPTHEGADLTIKKLKTAAERSFKYVTEYQVSKNGKWIAFAVTAPIKQKETVSGLYLFNLEKNAVKRLSTGRGNYRNISIDDAGRQIAFTAEKNPEKALVKPFKLYYYNTAKDSAEVIAAAGTAGISNNWAVSGDGKVSFSKSGNNLYFGTAPIPKPADTTLVDFEVAKLDIWNYKDDYLQPQQLKNLQTELKRSYLAVIKPEETNAKTVQLGSKAIPEILTAENKDARYVLGLTDTGARVSAQWEGSTRQQAILIDTRSGNHRFINASLGRYYISPQGNYVLWFDLKDQAWYCYTIATGQKINLSKATGTKMGDELNDVPGYASAYGMAGWLAGDKAVFIYDRYDIWRFDPATGDAFNFTKGIGRKNKLIMRYDQTDPEQKFIPLKEPMWLLTQNEETRQWGYFRKFPETNNLPEKAVMASMSYDNLLKAKNAEAYIYTKASYKQSPDLYFSSDLKKEIKLSSINLQQNDYNWGTAELVRWTTPKGYQSQGILYKPEDFDPAKKYPMIVYFYERLSDGLYNYIAPAPTPSRLPISFFVSNGYLVFAPDIRYQTGHPGASAVEFVNSGVEALKKHTWVDATHIGLQGQSWGGYQVAYLITQTNMYAAAWAGAPVANMTSAYGGIRWESGLNRQFQYEKSQSRIGATLWEKPELYIENSPLFQLPKVKTPVMIMSNDADGAVPWYQGIEMFTALRRLGKPVWLLQYNGEAHNLVLRQNRKDITIREQQFFDHFLKGAPMPVWMDKGVPAVDKGKDWGLELEK
ncbi:S9 family peptidase [Mucilaginibacter rubeus]|uniref:S9 family peptidase n=1 Tax=Mucilaginibacter rubeus TaxID=2027860 RepID=A0AAE6JDI3_9SPHI|nr:MULTISPECIES: prolyl oligopeptidase family serine peptidase [Mucilaginibacter]QEM03323.1 S9 family peptidase [Mucilaginibacter rubeus]QEM15941.1 S9 family peptidase [Mucilaginibacter gossypii]QTE41315.1 S9 family peptidase [Mucilaginibacter rubeus]QTE47919.1 S9 family peptidase [Mucilaginibacter rubeus]QTE59312.1 S9 family peptidase [Mucilaginibacter rubeus]